MSAWAYLAPIAVAAFLFWWQYRMHKRQGLWRGACMHGSRGSATVLTLDDDQWVEALGGVYSVGRCQRCGRVWAWRDHDFERTHPVAADLPAGTENQP